MITTITMCSRRNRMISDLFSMRYFISCLIIFLDITLGVADRFDACSSLCGDFIESPALPAPFPTRPPNGIPFIEPYGGGDDLQGRGLFGFFGKGAAQSPKAGGNYTHPSPFVRVYHGPVRTEEERRNGSPILTKVWDIIGLPRYHNISGYTGVEGYEETDENGNYVKVEKKLGVEHAVEVGPFIRPFPKNQKKPKPKPEKKKPVGIFGQWKQQRQQKPGQKRPFKLFG